MIAAGVGTEPPAPSAPVFAKEQVLALAGNPPYTEKPHTAMRRVIARRLAESKQTVPHFYMSVDCAIDELLKTRAALNAKSDKYRISVNDFAIRAAARMGFRGGTLVPVGPSSPVRRTRCGSRFRGEHRSIATNAS